MVTYLYRCPDCGDAEIRRAMGAAEPSVACPACARPARRVFANQGLRGLTPGLAMAMDAAGASAEAPGVVSSIPSAAGAPRPQLAHPSHAGLPRP